ncbi:MAG: DUF6350 family protein [Terracoccus sp.]
MSTLSTASSATAPASALPGAFRSGVLTALGTWAVVVLPALVGWVAAPESTLGWFSAVQVGSAAWFLGHAQSVGINALSISVAPLLLLLVFVLIAARTTRRLVALERTRVGALAWGLVLQRGVVPGYLLGYVAVAGLVALLTLGGPAVPGVAAVVGTLLVPLAGLGFALLRPADEDSPAFVRSWFRRGPSWLPIVWRVGWRGAGLLLAVGAVIAVARILFAWSEVASVQGQYGTNLAAGVVIGIAQLALLGNAAIWALSFVAGPGFQVAVGSMITPSAAQPGLMPLVPVLGALPDAANYPAVLYAVVLVPVAAGALVGRWVDRELEFFGNLRARLLATATAAVIAVVAVAVLAGLGNGAIGVERLSAVGVPLLPFTLALGLEVLVGACGWVGWRLWREHVEASSGDTTTTAGDTEDDADADATHRATVE